MTADAQTVIYRLDATHKPKWQFHSMPESAVGGGDSLDEAREQYRDALRFLLDTDELPEIKEYVEKEAHLGVWVRTWLGDPNGDALVREIGRQISSYPPEDLDGFFYRNPSAGGDPVVFHGGPSDPLSSIFQQMTPFDSLILVGGIGDRGLQTKSLIWIVIEGPKADLGNEPPVGLDELELTPDSTLGEVFAVARRLHDQYGEDLRGSRLPALLAPA